MSFITKKHLSRRTFLRGMGVTLSLPLLESMVPAQTPLAKTAANPRSDWDSAFMPHGAVMSNWTPAAEGALELSPILAPLEPHKDQVVVISNLAHAMAGPQGPGDNGGDHTRCPAVFLNGVHPKRTDGADIRAGTTIDQMAAPKIGQDTLLPSLELAIEDYSGLVGSCDVGFSCTYMNTISWRTPTSPMPMEINPRVVFDRMFGDGATAEERRRRIETQRSILDAVTSQVRRLQGGLGSNDRNRVAEYLDTVREIERRIQLSEKQTQFENLDVPVVAARNSGRPRRAHETDVRPHGDRVPGRHHAHLDVHDGARGQLPDVPDARHLRSLPSRVASSEQSRAAGRVDQDQHVPRRARGRTCWRG